MRKQFQMISAMLSVMLSVLLILSLSACDTAKEDGQNASVSSAGYAVNIAAYAAKGEIPEISYALGEDIDHLKETFADTLESGSEIHDLTVDEGDKTVWLDGGSVMFCYEKAKKDAGVSVIVAKEYAYGFAIGGVYDAETVIAAMGDAEYTRAAASDDDAFFLPVLPENSECITYQTGAYTLRFVLIDGALSAVTLTDPANWG